MLVRLEALGAVVVVNVEGVAYSGEVLRDMVTRACDGLRLSLVILGEYADEDEEEPADGDD
jgi:hypothetical protein